MWESRVLQRAFERLELHEGKLSRAVLRGGGGGDVTSLPDPQGSNPLGRLRALGTPSVYFPEWASASSGVHHTIGLRVIGVEAELLADAQHLPVVWEDLGGDPRDLLVAGDLQQPAEQLGAEPGPGNVSLIRRANSASLRRAACSGGPRRGSRGRRSRGPCGRRPGRSRGRSR